MSRQQVGRDAPWAIFIQKFLSFNNNILVPRTTVSHVYIILGDVIPCSDTRAARCRTGYCRRSVTLGLRGWWPAGPFGDFAVVHPLGR